MQIVISVGGKFHAYHTARAAQRAGCLKRFITTVYDETEAGIDHTRVTELRLPDWLGRALRRVPGSGRVVPWNWVKDNLFDLMATQHLPDCDIFHVWNNYGLFSLRKAKQLGSKVIVERGSAHPLTQQRLLREEHARWGLRFPGTNHGLLKKQLRELAEADYIYVPSAFARLSMVQEGIPADKLIEIPYGAELATFRPMARPDDVFRILFVGTVSLRKGIPYLLEAARTLDLPQSELLLVGRVDEDIETILAQHAGGFRAIGPVPHQKLPAHYARSSLFVLPSIEEGSALVTYEAMASGLPLVVTTNTGSIVRDGVDGFVVPIRDADALAEKILFFYENEEARRKMGKAAREYARQFTWERYGEQVIAAYRRILDSAR